MTTAASIIIPQDVKSLHVTPNPTPNYLPMRTEGMFTHESVHMHITQNNQKVEIAKMSIS